MMIREILIKKVQEEGSQSAVARRVGISQGTIAKTINGDSIPDLTTITKIAQTYNLPLIEIDELFPMGREKFKQFSESLRNPPGRSAKEEAAQKKASLQYARDLLAQLSDDDLDEVIAYILNLIKKQKNSAYFALSETDKSLAIVILQDEIKRLKTAADAESNPDESTLNKI